MPNILENIVIEHFKHVTPIQVRFNDTDQMGHVTNMQYLGYCDIARLYYFHEVFEEKVGYEKESLVIASVKLDFVKQIFFEEPIDVRTKISVLGNKSIQMQQLICNSKNNEIKCLVNSVMSGFNYIDQHSIVIPERWKLKIKSYEIIVEEKIALKNQG